MGWTPCWFALACGLFCAGCVGAAMAPQCFDLEDCPPEHLCIERECIPERLVGVDATARDDAEPVPDSITRRDGDEPADARPEVDLGAPDAAADARAEVDFGAPDAAADAATSDAARSDAQPQDAFVPCGVEHCDGLDNDCDGEIDEGFDVGEPCLVGLGDCEREGVLECVDARGVACNAVAGQPGVEVCANCRDDDCDGTVDEGCACRFGETRLCGTDIGECVPGEQACGPNGWGLCNDIGPVAETCDGLDNDCDGTEDNGNLCSDILDEGAEGVEAVCQAGSCLAGCLGDYFDPNRNVIDGCERGCPTRSAVRAMHPAVPSSEVAPEDFAVATDSAGLRWVAWVDPAGAAVPGGVGLLEGDRVRLFNPANGMTTTEFPPVVRDEFAQPALAFADRWRYLAVNGPSGGLITLKSFNSASGATSIVRVGVMNEVAGSPSLIHAENGNLAFMLFTSAAGGNRNINAHVLDDGVLSEMVTLLRDVSEFPFVVVAPANNTLVVVAQQVGPANSQRLLVIRYSYVPGGDPPLVEQGRLTWDLGGEPNRAAALPLAGDDVLLAAHVIEDAGSTIRVTRAEARGDLALYEASGWAPDVFPTSFGLTRSETGAIVLHSVGDDLLADFYGEEPQGIGYMLGPALPLPEQVAVRAAVALPGPSVFWLDQARFYTADLAACR